MTADSLDAFAETVDANRLLFRESQPADHLIILIDGGVELFQRSARLAKIQVGPVCMDEVVTIFGLPHTFTAVTTDRSRILRVPIEQIADVVAADPKLAQQLAGASTQHLQAASRVKEKKQLDTTPAPKPGTSSESVAPPTIEPASDPDPDDYLPDDLDQSAVRPLDETEQGEASQSIVGRSDIQRAILKRIGDLDVAPVDDGLQDLIEGRLHTHTGRMLQAMFWVVLGDFRYTTSKAAAGVDFLTSDTLAAAYATVRWNYRKRGKEIRDKASINNQETDRKNWRRHYILYMRSAFDAGKHLYHKCPELYDSLMKYLDLPEGVERLRKS